MRELSTVRILPVRKDCLSEPIAHELAVATIIVVGVSWCVLVWIAHISNHWDSHWRGESLVSSVHLVILREHVQQHRVIRHRHVLVLIERWREHRASIIKVEIWLLRQHVWDLAESGKHDISQKVVLSEVHSRVLVLLAESSLHVPILMLHFQHVVEEIQSHILILAVLSLSKSWVVRWIRAKKSADYNIFTIQRRLAAGTNQAHQTILPILLRIPGWRFRGGLSLTHPQSLLPLPLLPSSA